MRFVIAFWAAVVLAVSTVPLAVGYRSAWALPVLAFAALAPFALVALGRRLKVPTWAIAAAGSSLALTAGVMLLEQVADEAAGWRSAPALAFLAPLIDSVPRLLTAPRPAPPDPAHLVPSALLAWLTALVIALIVVGRRRAGASVLVGAAVLHLAGGLLTAGRGDPMGLAALTTVVVLLLGWVWLPGRGTRAPAPEVKSTADSAQRSRPEGQAGVGRRAWVVPTVVALVASTFAFAAVAVPTARSFEPRTLVPPPVLPVAATNPIPQVALWSAHADESLFTVQSATDDALPRRFTLVALPDFDGAAWTVDARLRAVGVVEDPDLPGSVWQRPVDYVVQPEALRGVWLPSVGRAESVEGADALMDIDTGVLVLPDGLSSATVRVTTTAQAASPTALTRAATPSAAVAGRYLELPRLPQSLRTEAEEVTAGLDSRWAQANAIEDFVRGERLLDHGAPSGSSYGRVQEFLYLDAEDGGQVGTSEQFAAAFAMLARAAGLPTRLVVGFDIGPDVDLGTGEPLTVQGGHARVWAEVYFARVGWVAFDPSPDVVTEVERPDDPVGSQGDEPEPTPEASEPPSAADAGQDANEEESDAVVVAVVLTLLAVLAAAVVVTLLISGVLRLRRRLAWRGSGDTGAWALVLESARLSGRPAPPELPAPQAALTCPEPVRGEAVLVAERAERAAYAPRATGATEAAGAPEAAGATDAGDGLRSWILARRVEKQWRRLAPWWRRALWFLWPLDRSR